MRRKDLLIGFALFTLSAAAAFAILPQNGDDLRGNLPFLPTELWSLSGNGQPPSGNPGGPPQNPPPAPHRDPFSALDLPINTAEIFVADLLDGDANERPASPPVGGHTPTGNPRPQPQDTGETSTDDGGSLNFGFPGSGFSPSGGFTTFRALKTQNGPSDSGGGDPGVPSPGSPGDPGPGDPAGPSAGDPGGRGPGGDGDPEPGGPGPNDDSQHPTIAVDEPAPLFLLLIGGLALVLTRRASRQAAR